MHVIQSEVPIKVNVPKSIFSMFTPGVNVTLIESDSYSILIEQVSDSELKELDLLLKSIVRHE